MEAQPNNEQPAINTNNDANDNDIPKEVINTIPIHGYEEPMTTLPDYQRAEEGVTFIKPNGTEQATIGKPTVQPRTMRYLASGRANILVPTEVKEVEEVDELKARELEVEAVEQGDQGNTVDLAVNVADNIEAANRDLDPKKFTLITGTRQNPNPTLGDPLTWNSLYCRPRRPRVKLYF